MKNSSIILVLLVAVVIIAQISSGGLFNSRSLSAYNHIFLIYMIVLYYIWDNKTDSRDETS